MFAKGKIRGNGAQLARYLMTGEQSERVELADTRGLEAFGRDPAAAFAALQNVADANTQSTKPFFHGHIRLPGDERLTDAQWMQTLDLMEKRLGFEGQPRIVTFHIDRESGDKHLHVGWFRIDLETMRAIDPGLYKNDLRQLCREQERAYGLRQLDKEERKPQANEPSQHETEESRRLGTDVREIRATILDCVEHSDSGKAFIAALEERGLMLANGDRRDCFVVIDQEGGHHALNKKLTGMTLAAMRERFADLDRSQLPGVEQAQEIQRHRQAERTVEPEPANQNTPSHEQMQDFGGSLPKADPPQAEKRDPAIEEFRAAAASITEPSVAALAPDPVTELAATAEAAADQATHAGEGLLRGLGKMFEGVISWLADSFAPPPPPTKEQAERNARASEERREQRAFDQAEQQQHTLQEFLIAEMRRTQQAEAERDPRLAEMMNLHTQPTSARRPEREAERDRD